MKYKGGKKHFEIKKNSERIVTTQFALEELLKKVLHGEGKSTPDGNPDPPAMRKSTVLL